MRNQRILLIAGAFALVGACSKTENGDVVVKKPVGVDVQTQTDTLHPPTVTTKLDTINAPVVGTQKDTVIVDKPVVGTEKKVVKVPVIKKNP
ncbi:MAG TPA: hypothetical protein VGM67_15465 [Gemmatimonadaceae bacterium]|jgi:hypothetical protein